MAVDYAEKIAKVEEAIAKKNALIEKRNNQIEKSLSKMNPLLESRNITPVTEATIKETQRVEDDARALLAPNQCVYENEFVSEVCEYCDKIWEALRSIQDAEQVIEEKKKTLETYKVRLNKSNEDVEFIESMPDCFKEFMNATVVSWDAWDAWMKVESKEKYDEMHEEIDALKQTRTDWYFIKDEAEKEIAKAKYLEVEKQIKEIREEYDEQYGRFMDLWHMSADEIHKKNEDSARRFIIDFCNRVIAITGEIEDCSNLKLTCGNQGYTVINGIVIGKMGKAKVQSIGAGGYNIQRWHIRTIVNEVH